jgi:type I restriction-modification system DNA methylase subunit
MDILFRHAIADFIRALPQSSSVIDSIQIAPDGTGTVTYNSKGLWVDPNAPGFTNTTTQITDEEMVRAYLLVRLATTFGYPAKPEVLEVERVYKPVGRPQGKGGRVDVLVRKPPKTGSKDAFLFMECKAPSKFDDDLKYIDGQLFRLSRQEPARPRFLIYYTVELKASALHERVIVIDTERFPDYESWDQAGQPLTDVIPSKYGQATKRRYANVIDQTKEHRPLDREVTPETFNRLRTEIHDVIWGGGGTNNNEVFILIVRLILCKIFDEKETLPKQEYRFQRLGDAFTPEEPGHLVDRLNDLYREAESAYLALTTASIGPAFDTSRISSEKVAYVVGRLEGLSITENKHPGDLLGEFFEQIVSQDFTQTRGQFFTPVKLVRFMLHLARVVDQAREVMLHGRDHLGRPRLPYVIDPSCGSGTFLIEYMKLIRRELGQSRVEAALPNRIRESHTVWFAGASSNVWAREYLFGIENNYDLGLSAKVNMVLHGDGSMNTWIKSGLLPFRDYWVHGRNNILGVAKPVSDRPYNAECNEQFDLLLSNPPFSIKLAPDEKLKVAEAFEVMANAQSEAIFIERWYQLLREGGSFCCVLPEAILDTSTYAFMRFFIFSMFRIRAIVSLPYDAFRPFTSTKTCIVYATKRSNKDVARFYASLKKNGAAPKGIPSHESLQKALDELSWSDETIFMAEPATIGYKRRKNLPDLYLPNELYRESNTGEVSEPQPSEPRTVLDYYHAGENYPPNPKLGFWTSLRNIISRKGFRLDPKYRWLWDFQRGCVHGDPATASELSSFLAIVELPKVPKGELAEEAKLVDLESVEARQALVNDQLPVVDTIGSDKIRFQGCDLAISKLEPYLGKIIINPSAESIGSTEWIGLKITTEMPASVAAYLLMLPDMCEAYRRLQSGKRHARFEPDEFLHLCTQVPDQSRWQELEASIGQHRNQIIEMRRLEQEIRANIDQLFTGDDPTLRAANHAWRGGTPGL